MVIDPLAVDAAAHHRSVLVQVIAKMLTHTLPVRMPRHSEERQDRRHTGGDPPRSSPSAGFEPVRTDPEV
ncbi:hypothetical protein ACHIPZ_25265 [Antrihabitans sp. NCIMB 15449]|uniref:Uncharacterized protein n=1 Tax=Antrihabitans spumae TaxID=3373370 RepID=A0ABW7JUS1_9NOCA